MSLMPRRTAAAARPCRPRSSAALSHGHSHALQPSLCATATLVASSESLSPTEAMGCGCNQSPECRAEAVSNLALFISCTALDMSSDAWLTATP